ncbi:flagellar filament capping protein FliD [Stenotrophomonas maltophilia]|uniref:flagellar filament capping protein FliD n=2 Tax=Bacteria TaxID=2 RepID=UPI000C1590AB|nr:flagellar filament capping protein FliD [Stenotrophomonas maltophilia]
MADFGYGGIGSGLDISSIVNQLVAADRKPADNALNLQQSKAKMQLSSIGTITSAFDKLKTALTALKATTAFDTRTVTASKGGDKGTDEILTASVALYDVGTTKAAASNGTHVVNVTSLATAHKLIADTSVPKTDTFAAGTLTLTVGVGDKAKTMNVEVEDGDTLTTIRNKIDAAGRKEGVQATLISSGDDQYLSIAQEKTGAANAIKLEYAGSDAKLGGGLVNSLKQNTAAADAELTIDGVKVVSASNTVADAVPGLTLNLKMPGTSTVTISTDTAAATKVMQEFVTAYNAALAAINTETKYDAKTKEASTLTGDAQMRGATSQLRSVMSSVLKDLAGDKLDAKAIGLDTRGYPNADGTLILDTTKFAAALASQPEKMRQAITGDTGGAGKLYTLVDGYVSTTVGKEGAFVARTKGLNTTLDNIDKRRKDLDTRMKSVEERYKKQFIALDSLMGKLQQSNTALQQQLAQLNR